MALTMPGPNGCGQLGLRACLVLETRGLSSERGLSCTRPGCGDRGPDSQGHVSSEDDSPSFGC